VSVVVGKTSLQLALLHSQDGITFWIKRRILIEQPRCDGRFSQLRGVSDERFVHEQDQKMSQSSEVSKRQAVNDPIELLSDYRRVPWT
jgi:hypothetical protein